jgi:RHS repeat-associated protein
MAYDPVGNTILRTDARNWPATYTMDALNRTVGTLYLAGTRVTNTFDAAGQQLTMQDVTGITGYAYDLAGRQVSVAYPTNKTLTYAFDATSNRTGLTDPDGGLTSYSWDSQNRLIGIVSPFADATTIAYDALNRELTKTLGNGMLVSHAYDAAGRETMLGNYLAGRGTSTLYTAAYDAVGNRLTVVEIDATRVTFGYDASYQLVNEQRSGTNAYNTTYAYDAVGNRTLKNDSGALTNYAYNAANEQILLTPPTGLPTTSSYDTNGNLTHENTGGALTTYSWDSENRLTQVVVTGTNSRIYTYSADGHRQQAQNGPNQTFFVWDQQNVLQETNSSLVTTMSYVQAPGTWGGLIRQQAATAHQFFGFDFTGSTRLLVTPSGSVAANYDYKAFGEELQSGGSGSSYRYGGAWGYYRDTASRLYVRARVLRTDLGRWISRDPIGFRGGDFNLYLYVKNGPVKLMDPTGNVWKEATRLSWWRLPQIEPDDGTCCGKFCTYYDLSLGTPLFNTDFEDGWIVQKVDITTNYQSCGSEKITGCMSGINNLTYWEAWYVPWPLQSPPDDTGFGYNDVFTFTGLPNSKSLGDAGWTITGTLKFFYNSTLELFGYALPWEWYQNADDPCHQCAHVLPCMSTRPPNFWSLMSDHQERMDGNTVTSCWNCCDPGKKSTRTNCTGGRRNACNKHPNTNCEPDSCSH